MLKPGQKIGKYKLRSRLANGPYATVFRALDTQLDRTVAVKVLSQDQAGDGETVRRFRNEAQSAARLDHENIGRIFDFEKVGDEMCIILEYIDGWSIVEYVERHRSYPRCNEKR